MPRSWGWRWTLLPAAIACTLQAAEAREAARLDIPADTLPRAIALLAEQAHVSIGSSGPLPATKTPALKGAMPVATALERLLHGTALIAVRAGPTAWRIVAAPRPVARPQLPAAPSAPAAPPAEVSSPPIIVTAAKQRFDLDAAPLSFAVAFPDRTAAPAQATLGTGWVGSSVEGLSFTALGPGRNRLFVRGVADSAFNGESQSTVAVLLDEARLTYAAPDPDIRLVDVERVELLKGPQGSLYGTGALGGIYQIVPRKPDLETSSLTAEAGVQIVAAGDYGPNAAGVLNLPLRRGSVALRLVAYGSAEPGWIDTGTRQDSNTTRVAGGRAALRWSPDARWTVDGDALVQNLNSRDSQYVYAKGVRSRPAQLPEPHDNDLSHVALRLARKGGAIDLHFASAMTWHTVDDALDATIGATGFGVANPRLLSDDRRYRVWDSEARAEGRWGSSRWLLGLAHLEARQFRRVDLSDFAGTTTLAVEQDRRLAMETALFGQIDVPLAPALKATLGGRLFTSRSEIDRTATQLTGSDRRHRDGLTPSASLAWTPRPGRLLFLRYGSAYRQGGLTVNGSTVGALPDDKLETIEAGWRESWGARGRFDLGVFRSNWSHLQSDVLGPRGLIETIDAGRANITGAEASLLLPLADGWRIEGGASYQSALLVRSASGLVLDDNHLPVVPRYVVRGALEHAATIGAVPLVVRIEGRYLGSERLSFDPALDRSAGDYLETRLHLGARWGRVGLGVDATNLLDSAANTFSYGNPLRLPTMPQFTPQAPRTVALTLRLLPRAGR